MLKNKDLAINGGTPVRTAPWKDNFTMGEEEKKAAAEVLDGGYLSLFEGSHTPDPPFSFWGGPYVQKLEREWAAAVGSGHALSVNSATSGLYAAIGALGIGFGDEVIVSPYTMSACAVSPMIYGAVPVFADVCPDSGSLDPRSIEARITERTKAIQVVHQFGIPAKMNEIMDIAKRHDLKVIEDCAQAHGATYQGRHVGTIGDIGVFSLNVNKTIQTGEGGLCVTDDPDLHYRLALIRNHGEAVVGPAGYENITNMVGFNYRMCELEAAIGSEQLKKLERINKTRVDYVKYLNDELSRHDCIEPLAESPTGSVEDGTRATYYVYPCRFLPEKAGVRREEFVEAINAEGLLFFQGYVKPLYTQPLYQQKNAFKNGYPFSAPENAGSTPDYSEGACPAAERLHYKEMLINEHVRLPQTWDDIRDIVNVFNKVLG